MVHWSQPPEVLWPAGFFGRSSRCCWVVWPVSSPRLHCGQTHAAGSAEHLRAASWEGLRVLLEMSFVPVPGWLSQLI